MKLNTRSSKQKIAKKTQNAERVIMLMRTMETQKSIATS